MWGRKEGEWWITIAGNDLDAWNALGLCKSLRLTLTTRKICIVVANAISKEMREILQEAFDCVYDMHRFDAAEMTNINAHVLLTMSIWKCEFARRAVFIHPQSTVLRNCDELFQMEEGFIATPSLVRDSSVFELSVLVFCPSTSKFDDAFSFIRKSVTNNGSSAEKILSSYLREKFSAITGCGEAGMKYNCLVDGGGCYDASTKILRFASGTPWIDLGEECRNPWLLIHSNGVLPPCEKFKEKRFESYFERSLAELKIPREVVTECEALRLCLRGHLNETVSIVGLSCRFPGANNAEEFWQVLLEGRDETKPLPTDRISTSQSTLREDGKATPVGYLKCSIQDFDAKFFEISRREAEYMDPQQRLLLEVTWESLENAGINPMSLAGTNTSVFAGLWAQEYAMHLANTEKNNQNFQYKYLGNAFCASSARISHFFGLRGPSVTVESGCASSLQAVHQACESLRNGITDLAIGCGVNIALGASGELSSLDAFILSKDGKCKTFDESADGFARGEACVSLILKRTPDAIRDGNSILGIILGGALNNDGGETAMGTPSAKAQELVLKEALANSRISSRDVSFIEAHGTGTPVGDPTEFHALSQVFADGRSEPLIIGSVKTNIGHSEGCSGLAGLVKVLLCMRHHIVPKHLHLNKLNPYINLNTIPAIIPLENMNWIPRDKNDLIAGISSFGLSGTNVHLVLQEPPKLINPRLEALPFERTCHVFTLSAKSEPALEELSKSYICLLESNPSINLADLAFSVNTGRAHFRHRLAVVARDIAQLSGRLKKGLVESGSPTIRKSKVAFLFTGQGSQYSGMAKTFYDTHPQFRTTFQKCADSLLQQYDIDLYRILNYRSDQAESKEDLNSSIFSQPSIFCVEVCLAELWASFGICPDFVLGHSVGEFAAAVVAGVISFEDGLKLVVERSRLVGRLETGSMLVVRASRAATLKLALDFENGSGSWVDIAAVNSENEVVISGRHDALKSFSDFCHERSINTQRLLSSHAFHSRDMDQILQDYKTTAMTVVSREGKCVYMSGTLAKVMNSNEFTTSYWLTHLREPVNFQAAFNKLLEHDCTVVIEIGAQPVLLALGMSLVSPETLTEYVWCPTIRKNEDNWTTMLTSLVKLYTFGVDIDWLRFDSAYNRKTLCLPNYPFQREPFWLHMQSGSSESISVNSKLAHPILGRRVPSPNSDTVMYHNTFSLETLSYVRDHVVANKVVLPGAAYLELILAACRDIVCGGTKGNIPMEVDCLTIESALLLEESQCVQIQTLVHFPKDENELKYKVEIFKQTIFDPSGSDGGKWKRLVTAEFTTSVAYEDCDKQFLNISSLQASLALRESADDIYKKLAGTGITFGPSFRSIERFWYSDDELLVEISQPPESDKYIFHPVVLDATIQACIASWSLNEKDMKGLYLPISIGKFVSFPCNVKCCKLYIYSRRQQAQDINHVVKLYTEGGQQVAIMGGLDIIKTTESAFLRLTNSEVEKYPGFYEETWLPHVGPWAKRWELNRCGMEEALDHSLEFVAYKSALLEEEKVDGYLFKEMDQLSYRYILRSLLGMGWSFRIGDVVELSEFAKASNVLPKYSKLLRRWFEILEEENDLRSVDNTLDQYAVCSEFYSHDIETSITKLLTKLSKNCEAESRFVQHCGEKLESLIKGKVSIHSVFFPDAAALVYRGKYITKVHVVAGLLLGALIRQGTWATTRSTENKKENVLRIIEVGAGTGSATEMLLMQLAKLGIRYEYMITDISALLLSEMSKRFAGQKYVKFKLYDVEKDPLDQGFNYHYYDLLLADNVFHTTENISVVLKNVARLLVPQGLLVLNEQVKPQRVSDISFGFMDGWWRFNDYTIRKNSPILNTQAWIAALRSQGFENATVLGEEFGLFPYRVIAAFSSSTPYESRIIMNRPKCWLLFGTSYDLCHHLGRELTQVGRTFQLVQLTTSTGNSKLSDGTFVLNPMVPGHFADVFHLMKESLKEVEGIIFISETLKAHPCLDETRDFERMYEMNCALLHLLQAVAVEEIKPMIVVVTKGAQFVNEQHPFHPISATLWGVFQCFNNEFNRNRGALVDLDPEETLENSATDLFHCLWQNDAQEFQIAFRNRNVYYKRLLPLDVYKQSLCFPNSERYKLQKPLTGLLSDLVISASVKTELGPKDVEIKMQCTSLNFKDLLLTLNSDGATDLPMGTNATELGLDICGVLVRVGTEVKGFAVGDEVVGICPGGALASHVIVNECMISHKPLNASVEEAAIVNTIFATAYYFLVEIGQLNATDKLLIHTASGGVGLAAVQVAKDAGADIYVTAGSRRKRNYLRAQGLTHVYKSRDTDFVQEIQRDTNGSGVDIVLNSITGSGFKEATLSVCAKNARFLEMSKINVWTKEEVASLRPDVFYFIQELNFELKNELVGAFGNAETFTKIRTRYLSRLGEGRYDPIPITLFPFSRCEDAFRFLQESKQIGKVAVKLPETSLLNGRVVHKENFFNAEYAYLITGGMGGIGLEVAKWMAESGARFLVLVGRSPPSAMAEAVIGKLKANKINVLVLQADVSDFSQCQKVLREIDDLYPPLKGIMHAAGVISDNAFPSQNAESLLHVYKPKIQGTMNLHVLTKSHFLHHFVLFSSIASTFGGIGQCNHSAANKYLDAFAQYRVECGYPCCSVNWGPWSDVGAAAGLENVEGAFGVRMFTPAQGIAALERALFAHRTNTVVFDVSNQSTMEQTYNLRKLLEFVKSHEVHTTRTKEYDAKIKEIMDAEPHERRPLVQDFIEFCLREILKLDDHEPLDPDQDMRELGLDSLMGMEVRSRMQPLLTGASGKTISLNDAHENRTINKLTTILCNILNKNAAEKSLTTEQLLALVRSDSVLDESIVPFDNGPYPAEIRSVLLTGSTGFLGRYILRELVKQNPGLTVYCLVRASSDLDAKERLGDVLSEALLEDSLSSEKVVCVAGNITRLKFDLGDEKYEELANSVDAVLHCAVLVDFMLQYGPFSEEDIRSTNVLGLKNILKFATTGKTKRLLFPGNIYALTGLNPEGSLPDSFPADDDFGESLKVGYHISKLICEKLLKQAVERGLPVIVLRHHHLLGDSKTGFLNTKRDYTAMLLLTCQKLGKFPEYGGGGLMSGVAVDIAASISVRIFLMQDITYGVYNVNNPKTCRLVEMHAVFERKGVKTDLVPYDEWREAAILYFGGFDPLSGAGQGYTENFFKSLASEHARADPSLEGNSNLYANSPKIKQYVPDIDDLMVHPIALAERHLDYYESVHGKFADQAKKS